MTETSVLPQVTVAVPIYNEAPRLPGLLQAIRAQRYPQERIQVFLLDGGSEDGSAELAREAAARHANVCYLSNPGRLAATALNTALARAEGSVFLRLDARARPEPDYIATCCRRLAEGRWAGVAGPQRATGETWAGRVHALALNHPFGTGAPAYRRVQRAHESESLWMGAYDVRWLHKVGGWDERFAANEDFDLNTRLRHAGGRLLVDPQIRCFYLARDSLRELGAQYARYGAWRTVTWRRHPDAMHVRHMAPTLFVAILVLALLLTPLSVWPLLFLLASYLTVDGLVSLHLARRLGLRALPRLLVTFPTLHLAWGCAFWWAWLRPPNHRR
ncbi:MAG: glycosyltransferase [Caldilineae bacterium]|nr:MAG: glycosyltransferase [Caldilineae bacterium]